MDSLYKLVETQMTNEFFSGGALLVVLTALLAYVRNTPVLLYMWLKRVLVVTVDVTDHDEAFFWLQKWLSEHEYSKKSKRLTLSTRMSPFSDRSFVTETNEDEGPNGMFSPAPGNHWIRHNGHFILVTKNRRESDHMGMVAYHETIQLMSFSRKAIEDIIKQAHQKAFPPEEKIIKIYKSHLETWCLAQKRPPRDYKSVVLQDGVMERLEKDLTEFYNSKGWYDQHGIPYQRGYLLHGEPGNGKTSTIVALASKFGLNVCLLHLASMSDVRLTSIISTLPDNSFLVIEDVDCVFSDRDPKGDPFTDLTFSGFLNAIDGIAATPGRVMFMTTNHVEKLDPALIRPGRVDVKLELRNADKSMAKRMFLNFFPGEDTTAESFATCALTDGLNLSMADLQEVLIENRKDPEQAVSGILRHPKLQKLLGDAVVPRPDGPPDWPKLKRAGSA